MTMNAAYRLARELAARDHAPAFVVRREDADRRWTEYLAVRQEVAEAGVTEDGHAVSFFDFVLPA
jgi:hypothetical protein